MNKALTASLTSFILSALETATWIWGPGWWSEVTEEFIAGAITLLTPVILYFFVSRAE